MVNITPSCAINFLSIHPYGHTGGSLQQADGDVSLDPDVELQLDLKVKVDADLQAAVLAIVLGAL